MGCPCRLRLDAVTQSRGRRLWQEARRELLRLEQKYSRYLPDGQWQRLLAAARTPEGVEVDHETGALLDLAARAFELSGGRFDVSCAPLSRLWDFRRGVRPQPAQIAAARAVVGWPRVRWRKPQLCLPHPAMDLDLDGLVKEYAADAVAALLRQRGVQHGYVDLGGDLALLGPDADGRPWRIGIRAPAADGAPALIEIGRGGLATSGDYERCIEIDGRRYSHLIDPRTGVPVEGLASVSVVGEQCTAAGIAATTGMLKGPGEVGAWLDRLGLPYLIIDARLGLSGTLRRAGETRAVTERRSQAGQTSGVGR